MNEIKKLANQIYRLERQAKLVKEKVTTMSVEAFGDNLRVLCLETVVENALRNEGVDSLKKLVALTRTDLAKMPMIGRKYLIQIVEALESRNMYLHDPWRDPR
jgi:DNA-directed RNA polymerase alpha subunit